MNNLRGKSKVKNHQGSVTVTYSPHEAKSDGATPPLGMKLTLVVLVSLFMLSLVSALYVGETYEHTFDGEILNCSTTSSLNLTWIDSTVFAYIEPDYNLEDLNISCWISKYESGGSSGGGGGSGHLHKKNVTNVSNSSNVTIPVVPIVPPIVNPPIVIVEEEPKDEYEEEVIQSPGDKYRLWIYLLGGILFFFILWCIWILAKKKKKEKGKEIVEVEIEDETKIETKIDTEDDKNNR